MTRTIPHSVIIESYLWEMSAADVVAGLNHFYGAKQLTVSKLQEIWELELESNTPLRLLGDRPAGGFPSGEEIALIAALVSKSHRVAA